MKLILECFFKLLGAPASPSPLLRAALRSVSAGPAARLRLGSRRLAASPSVQPQRSVLAGAKEKSKKLVHCSKILALLIIPSLIAAPAVIADEVYTKNKKGNELYKKGIFDEALSQYEDALLVAPADTLLRMNRGSALYRLGRVEEADSAYRGTLGIGNRRKRADAHYNLGDILVREGDRLMQSGGQGANEKYQEALQQYIASLDLQPNDKDAKWNIELTQRRIRQAEQQKQQNQQNQDKNRDNQNKQQNRQDQKNQQDQQQNRNQKQQNQNQDQKKDQNKDQQNRNSQNDKQQQEKQQQQPQQNKDERKKEEAKRLVAQFADDADTLNKPPKKQGLLMRFRKPEKDW